MGAFPLNLQAPKNIHGIEIGIDPKPDWSLDNLLTELNLIESKSSASPLVLRSSNQTDSTARKNSEARKRNGGQKSFIIRITDDDMDELDSDDEIQNQDQSLVPELDSDDEIQNQDQSLDPANQFTYPDVYFSDDEREEESRLQGKMKLVNKMGLEEGALLELGHEYQLGIKDEIRNHLSAWETQLLVLQEKYASALAEVEKTAHVRKEMDRELDLHYQRKIAEGLDNHLTAVQRDHAHQSQEEEKKIRDDAAAIEEVRRKEKALQDERLRQQTAKAEEEARHVARRAEEARKAKNEAERKAANEAAEREVKENARKAVTAAKEVAQQVPNQSKNVQPTGNIVRAAESALKLEETRSLFYKELEEKNQALKSNSGQNFMNYTRQIARPFRSIRGTIDNVRAKVSELIAIFNDPGCPQSLSASIFAKEVVSKCEGSNGDYIFFACAHVIVFVSSQVPLAMDCLLAELNRACIYTVPKYLMYSQSSFETKDAYDKPIGFRKEDGKRETTEDYIERLKSYMKLYGALVQTETVGVRNIHGIEEGWRWLARFLNFVPGNHYTLVALEAFLSMAGFALHRKFRSQFLKVLNTISRDYLGPLKQEEDPQVKSIIYRIESCGFLQEPKGRQLQGELLSLSCVLPTPEQHQQGYNYDRQYY